MKKIYFMIFNLLVISLLSAQITFEKNFAEPSVITNDIYSIVDFEETQQFGEIGEPSLPWQGFKILLPEGHIATSVSVERNDRITIDNITLLPVQPVVKLSDSNPVSVNPPEGELYYSSESYPQKTVRNLTTQFQSGFSIAFFIVSPVEYNPFTGEAYYYSNISISIETEFDQRAQESTKYLHNSVDLVNRVNRIVDNPEMMNTYNLTNSREEEIDYLIIAEASKVTLWEELAAIHNGFGRSTHIETIDYIYSNYTGIDSQEKIRNYLKDMYEINSIKYVLLGGDVEVIPHRGLYAAVNGGDTQDTDIPADMYYSCLDRGNNINNGPDWNNDNDDKWGEEDEADLIPEFAIGRFPYNNDLEIQNFIHKVDSYMNYPVADQLSSTILIGEDLGWEAWGGDFMDELLGSCATNGHLTNGIPSSWDVTTLYDRDATWNSWDLMPLLSEGNNLVNHLGHSSTTYNMKLENGDVTQTNISNNGIDENFSILFTQGCYAGAFDNRTSQNFYTDDCISEKFVSIATFAASVISHSRYGWGSSSGTGGASQFYHREYLDAIFNDNIYDLGYALNQAKIESIPFISGVMYWVDYETNILGDPGLIVWTENAVPLAVTHPSEIVVGSSQITVTTAYENVAVAVLNGNEYLGSGLTNSSGEVTINFFDPIEEMTQLTIQASKHNYLAYHGTVGVIPANAPYVVCQSVEYTETGEYIDGVIQSLDKVYLNLSLKNIGLQNTPDEIVVELTTESQDIEILNGNFSVDSIESLQENLVEEACLIQLGSSISNNTVLEMTLTLTCGIYNWQSNLLLTVKAPELQLNGYVAVATSGEDTSLDPGESGNVQITLLNTGSGYSYNVSTSIYTVDPFLMINGMEMTDVIEPDGSYTTGNFEIQILEGCPDEYYGQVEVLVYDEIASGIITSFQIPIGIHGYDFENENIQFNHVALTGNFTDQWHRDNYRNHTNNGEYSMKCGGEGNTSYNGSLHSGLYTPSLNVNGYSFVKFWHWMRAEVDNGTQAWDGGNIMISVNNGEFELFNPIGGYPYTSTPNNDSPFEGNTPIFSGTINWEEVELDLSGIIGEVVICFVFGSDSYVAEEGWYIDDITLGSYTDSDEETMVPVFTELNQNYPNPFNPTTNISYQLAESGKTDLLIYNVKGQIVRGLVNDIQNPGVYNIIWDGKDDKGKSVSSGVYFYLLKTPTYHSTKKMLMMK